MNLKILLLLFISSLQLFAGYSGEIFTSGYHDIVVSTLNAVSGLAASNNGPLIKIATAIAVLIMSIKVIFNQNVRNIAGFEILKMGTFVIAIQALFINAPDDDNHAYAVIDRISLQTTEVRQVPKGIGEFLSLFTMLEDGIMKKMELYFSTPDSLSYRQAGLGFTISTQMEIMRTNIVNVNLKKSFAEYIDNCKVDGDFSTGDQNLQYLISASGTNILTQLGTERTSLTLVYTDLNPNGEVMSCKDAWVSIKSDMGTEAFNNQAAYAKARGLVAQTYATKVANAEMITGINNANIAAKDQLVAAIARNATVDAVQKVANFNGVSDSLLTKQLSISELSMTNSSILSNYQAQQTVPILKALCTAFIIVLSWIAGILAIATMNAGYIKFLIILNVWLMLWSPLFQVLNFAIDLLVSDALSMYDNGLNASNQVGVYEILGGKLAIVTNLVWSVPILAFGIAKGGEFAMTQFVSAMVAPVQNAAHHTTKDDLSTALSGKSEYLGPDGIRNERNGNTGTGYESKNLNANGNPITTNSGQHTTTVESSTAKGTTATVNSKTGEINVTNPNANSSVQNAVQQSLANAEQNVKTLQNGLANESSNVASKVTTNGDGTVTSLNTGNNLAVTEADGKTFTKMNSAASSNAFNTSNKNALVDSISNDKQAMTALGLGVNSGSSAGGAILEKLTGASVNFSQSGNIAVKTADGTSFELSKNSQFGKEFTENYQKSMTEQIQSSKGNTQAYANVVSAVNGENQSDSNSTARKVSQAYSELDSASQTYQSVKSQGTANSDNIMTSAFQNFFDKNERFKNASAEDKADFMVNKMVEWNQSESGIKDRIAFVKDNTNQSELKNTVDNKDKINNGEKELRGKTSDVKETNYNDHSNEDTKAYLKGEGKRIENSNLGNKEVENGVNNHVKKDGEVGNNVDEKLNINGKVIGAKQDENANKVHDSITMNVAEGLENFGENVKDTIKNLPGGTDDHINPDIKRFADNNATQNETTYKNSKLGNNNLIEDKILGKDDINSSQLGKASTEDLARIYTHDKNHDKLSNGAKVDLHNELEKRGYDFKTKDYSSNYEGETPNRESIIPNGDGGNPGSSARKLKNDFKDEESYKSYDWTDSILNEKYNK